jgi:hypothetical protein
MYAKISRQNRRHRPACTDRIPPSTIATTRKCGRLTSRHQHLHVLMMRTTLTLDDDVAAALERLRRSRRIGLKRLVNEALRRGT